MNFQNTDSDKIILLPDFPKYKLVFLGDEGVGKTSIVIKFFYDKFDTTYQPTIGIDFLAKTIYLEDGTVLRLQFWDTAGQERFRSLIPGYIKDASVAVIVYDVCNRQSFLSTAKWIKEVRKERGTDVIIVLVGTKADLVEKRQVSIEEGEAKAHELGVMFVETSARAGCNLKRLFTKITTSLPKIETLSTTKHEGIIEVNVTYSKNTSQSSNTPQSSDTSHSDQLTIDSELLTLMRTPGDTYKVLFLGDQTVGKTSILTRFVHEKFDTTYKATSSVSYFSKRMYIENEVVNFSYRDTIGKESYRSAMYVKDSSIAVIVYDVTNRESFLNTTKWIEEVRTQRGADVSIVLVGNKMDLAEKRQVSIDEGEAKAQELGVMFIETSSKSGFNIKALFLKTAAALPKTETLSSTKQKCMADMNLKSSISQSNKTLSSTKREDMADVNVKSTMDQLIKNDSNKIVLLPSLPKYKFVILGDEAVGKTSIVTKFMYNKFDTTYQATIGIDFLSKTMFLEDNTLRLQIWDTAGQKRFASLIPSYIRESSIAVIVYDVSDRESFLNTAKWIEEVHIERGADVLIVLVGNKNDLVEKRQVSTEEGEAKARELGVMFIETSARAGCNIQPLFQKIATSMPKIENISSTEHEDMIELNLKYSSNTSQSDKLKNGLLMLMIPPSDTYEVLFLGDQTVGKTSILTTFIHEKFDSTYKATSSVSYFRKRMYIENKVVTFSYRDTVGKESYRNATYIKDSSIAVIVYDVTNRQSFLNTTKWIEEVRTQRGANVIVVLVGNKTDLVEIRQVSIEEGEAKARELGVMFIETSSKSGFNVKPLFLKTAVAALPKTETHSSTKKKDMADMNLKSSTSQSNETLSSTKHEDMVDVNLKSSSNSSQSNQLIKNESVVLMPLEHVTKYKVVYLGDQAVGKTSINERFIYEKFDTRYKATIGIDFMSVSMCIEGRKIRLRLWDTPGQERFRYLIPTYVKDSVVAVIVYDVTNRQSFLNIANWIEVLRKEGGADVIIVLVGNKTDLVEKRQVSSAEGQAKAHELGIPFIETSAKVGFNIQTLFMWTTRLAHNKTL